VFRAWRWILVFTTGMGAIHVSCFPLFSYDMMEAHVGLALNAKMHWAF
jgi:hypothetical protein